MEQFSTSDFVGTQLTAPGPVAVCFLATWCPFCRDFLPTFAAAEPGGRFRLAVADISEESNSLWETFGIEIVPTIVAFEDGRPFWRKDGIGGYGLDERDLAALRSAFEKGPTQRARRAAGE
ncbi:MAG: thioredoxin family protein [Thermoplasmata archaeon]|nr:thioredoxin family protein [Thermoplasmata archaeon]